MDHLEVLAAMAAAAPAPGAGAEQPQRAHARARLDTLRRQAVVPLDFHGRGVTFARGDLPADIQRWPRAQLRIRQGIDPVAGRHAGAYLPGVKTPAGWDGEFDAAAPILDGG